MAISERMFVRIEKKLKETEKRLDALEKRAVPPPHLEPVFTKRADGSGWLVRYLSRDYEISQVSVNMYFDAIDNRLMVRQVDGKWILIRGSDVAYPKEAFDAFRRSGRCDR